MRTLTRILSISVVFFMATSFLIAQSQIQLEGLYSEGEGGAGWDADGSGPEPYGNGHNDVFYYVASRDYVDPDNSVAGCHFLDDISGFPNLVQALADNGYTAAQATMQLCLASMGDDIEGEDWFNIDDMRYANFYPVKIMLHLNGEPMLMGVGTYNIFYIGPSTAGDWHVESGFFSIQNVSDNSSSTVQAVTEAFLQDMEGEELRLALQVTYAGYYIGNNGRLGAYTNLAGTLEKGLSTFPFQGLNIDHQGFAGWDADGSGPEPVANGHNTQLYYAASIDYDDIDPDPNACLGHLLDGHKGFLNTSLQLQYRGYEIGDIKLKLGLNSLGPDVEGEDWGTGWSNYYNNLLTIELDGEPILTMLADTNKLVSMGSYWMSGTAIGKVYDISENASPEAQFVAQSFLKDMGTHYLKMDNEETHYVSLFDDAGRDGAIYEITAASLVGVHEKVIFIPEGTVSGTWTTESSPYYIDGHLSIEIGQTLTIESGVKVAVRGPYHFDVQGCVIAEGTADANIIFTRSNPNLMWDGIDYDGTPASNNPSVFDHCIFEYGKAQGVFPYNCGGALAVRGFSKINISNSIFRSNMAIEGDNSSGGAIALWNTSPVIQKCIFYNNTAILGGAILCYVGSNAEINNNLFYNNTAEIDAGALEIWESSPTIINNTFSMNNADNYGGAVDVYSNSKPVFVNNIFWGNTAGTLGQQISITSDDCKIIVNHCDVEGGEAGIGPYGIGAGIYKNNIDEDPAFLGNGESPYALEGTSACVDAGRPADWYMIVDFDIIGNQRVLDGNGDGTLMTDMGAYEYVPKSEWIMTEENSQAINLNPNYKCFPNPFNTQTTIVYELEQSSHISLKIQKLNGQDIMTLVDEFKEDGIYQVVMDGSMLEPGVYFCVIKTNEGKQVMKMVKY